MSKLSEPLKALINAGFASPGPAPASKGIRSLFEHIAKDSASKNIATRCWLTIATATSMTMNSPASMKELYDVATAADNQQTPVEAAELMREVGLKCIGFNGIPRSINCLGAFRSSLPEDVVRSLSTEPTRTPSTSNIDAMRARGLALWSDIYRPFDAKLLDKLAASHPDLPVHIINSHYSALFTDPPEKNQSIPRVGRTLTSLVGISCLRAQTGVGPQVLSHVFGLRKAFDDDGIKTNPEADLPGARWLAGEEGNFWILQTVDAIVREIGEGEGTTYAPGLRAKL
ncbi:conserved mitochondrial protein [Diplodia corticola]|uniref:Conserved mitochondrial protein n=1 Tax=Diplodia corticola TaxID=236234 RepID=A0A1J9S0W4_9PEZI|nr:conserved mitochondrial protein [Diplodia corticola]OJD33668.1 conserved mitochondrial protein [Diplodia corticola]